MTAEALEPRRLLATFVVGNTNDAGAGSLRQAILDANAAAGADVIQFNLPAGAQTINLAGALPNLSTDIDMQGPGANLLTIRRNTDGNYRIFNVPAGATVSLSGMTISNGNVDGDGGGILNAGTLTISDATVAGNHANFGGAGGIANTATLTLNSVTVADNTAAVGAVVNFSTGTLIVTGSTISGNTDSGGGGGGLHNAGTATLTNSTIAGNTALGTDAAGGIFNFSGSLTLNNVTVADNTASSTGSVGGIQRFGGTVTLNNSIVSLNSGTIADVSGTMSINSSLIGGNPGLELDGLGKPLLKENGGPTHTIALLAGGLAINAGSNALVSAGVTTDQRGAGFSRTVGGVVDVGAFEFQGVQSLVVTTVVDEDNGHSDPAFGTGTSLREAIIFANANPGADTITFNLPAGAQTINLAGVLPNLSTDINIQGAGANLLTIRRDTGGNYRIFTIPHGATVSLSDMTISNGNTSGNDGGGIRNDGTLMLSNSTVSGNFTAFGGGIQNNGTLTVTGSTVSGNTALLGGGINNNGTLTLSNSTVSENSGILQGGGIRNFNTGILAVNNSTISGNTANGDSGGGGLAIEGTATLTNSTIAGNTAHGSNAAGGIFNHSGSLTLNNVTVAGNTASNTNSVGGIQRFGGTVTLNNSIVSLNNGPTADVSGTVSVNSSLIGGNPGLELDGLGKPLLKDNGGPTHTIALLPGSAAINAGSNALIPVGITTDQRGPGFPRIVGGTVDIGAYEFSAPVIPPQVEAGSFQFLTRHDIRIEFNRDVTITGGAAALQVLNLTTGQPVPSASFVLQLTSTPGGATIATWIASSPLPDGNYRATLPADSVVGGGQPMAADFTLDFFFLAGDATRDGIVNLADFNRLAANFGQSPRDFTQGDFNYDGIVNLADFNILAARFGQTIGLTSAAARTGTTAFSSARLPTLIADDAPASDVLT